MEPEFAVDEALQQSWEDGIDNILDIASEYFYPLPTTETDLELFEDALESGDRTAAYELAMSVWARGHPLAEGAIVRVFVSFPDSDSRMSTLSRCVEQWDEAAGKNATEEINGKAALANSCAHVTDSADEARALMIAMQSSAVSQTLGSVLCSKFVLEGRPRFPARDTPFAVLIRASERCCFVALEELSVYCPTFVPSRAKELTHKAAQIGSLVAIADSALFILREKNKSLRKVAWRLAEKSAKGWCHRGMFALGQLHESEGDRVSASLYYARAVHCRSLLLGVTIGLSHSLLTEYENALHRVSDGRDQDYLHRALEQLRGLAAIGSPLVTAEEREKPFASVEAAAKTKATEKGSETKKKERITGGSSKTKRDDHKETTQSKTDASDPSELCDSLADVRIEVEPKQRLMLGPRFLFLQGRAVENDFA